MQFQTGIPRNTQSKSHKLFTNIKETYTYVYDAIFHKKKCIFRGILFDMPYSYNTRHGLNVHLYV